MDSDCERDGASVRLQSLSMRLQSDLLALNGPAREAGGLAVGLVAVVVVVVGDLGAHGGGQGEQLVVVGVDAGLEAGLAVVEDHVGGVEQRLVAVEDGVGAEPHLLAAVGAPRQTEAGHRVAVVEAVDRLDHVELHAFPLEGIAVELLNVEVVVQGGALVGQDGAVLHAVPQPLTDAGVGVEFEAAALAVDDEHGVEEGAVGEELRAAPVVGVQVGDVDAVEVPEVDAGRLEGTTDVATGVDEELLAVDFDDGVALEVLVREGAAGTEEGEVHVNLFSLMGAGH